ncbi:MAG: hypothetical protein PHF97_10160 [Bacteroidales bacterium]|nr:hypothetical protein [Bacteroidales bacterium]
MRICLFILILTGFSLSVFGQNDSTNVYVKSGSSNEELDDYFSLIGAKSITVKLKDSILNGKRITFVFKEFKNSKLQRIDSLNFRKTWYESKIMYFNEFDSMMVRFMQIKNDKKTIKILIHYPRISTYYTYKIDPKGQYDFRYVNCKGDYSKISINQPFPILIYTTPFVTDRKLNLGSYCMLGLDGTPVENWGEKYNLKHYIVIEIYIN